jgi:hypothetical protein
MVFQIISRTGMDRLISNNLPVGVINGFASRGHSVIQTSFAQGSGYANHRVSLRIRYVRDHNDIRSAFDFRAAATALCSDINGRQRPDHNWDRPTNP